MNCPLCNHSSPFLLRTYDVDKIRKLWVKAFKFDPFGKDKDTNSSSIKKLRCSECGIIYYDPNLAGDAEFYEKISQNSWYYEDNKWEFKEGLDIVARYKPKSLLEIGCGNGNFLEKIRHVVKIVKGVEINQNAVDICKSKGLDVENMELSALNAQYDMIVAFQLLEHISDVSSFLDSVVKCLNDYGMLLIAVPNPDGYLKEIDTVLLDMPPHHSLGLDKSTFQYIADKYNLEILDYRTEPLRYIHYEYYMKTVLLDAAKFRKKRYKLFHKLQMIFFYFLAPFTFIRHKSLIEGQTHLILLRKNKKINGNPSLQNSDR